VRFFEYESRQIVKQAGIPTTKFGFATTPAQARAIATDIAGP
jgi:succinyl-CoA synthetase beta subunit